MAGVKGMKWRSPTSAARKAARNRWIGIMRRCYKEDSPHFPNWGGKGIRVHRRWHDFEAFYKDTGEPPGKNYTIDRLDPKADYGPLNWRWATQRQQQRNKGVYVTKNCAITDQGVPISRSAAAKRLGCLAGTLNKRMKIYKLKGVDTIEIDELLRTTERFRVRS